MAFQTKQKEILVRSGTAAQTQEFITLGTVVDTNDPQQMGRVRAVCPAWGDSYSSHFEDIPWCMYASPFGGQVEVGTRGPGLQQTQGGVAYGMWAIPKIGAQVLVVCLDGDPQYRVYLGCVFDQLTPHTLPHGRWMYDNHPGLQKDGMETAPYGPYSSTEKLIEPLNKNIKQAFGNRSEPNYEWKTRAGDYSASNVPVESLQSVASRVADDKDVTNGNWTSTQGYGVSRIDPAGISSITDKNYDSHVYSITTPGFHSLSMDDRIENSRVRIRTTSGHQILMDDTNERIYIQTARGNNWIELDQAGNIDVYTSTRLNIRAAKDINLTSDETIRMSAKQGIHMYSEGDVRVQTAADVHMIADGNIRTRTGESMFFQADGAIHAKTGSSFYLSAATEINQLCGADMKLTSGGSFHNAAAGSILETAASIHMNGPSASSANDAENADEQQAFLTNRVPDHEPYARTMTKDDFTHEPEFSYTDPRVNRVERGHTITRGAYWRR